MSIVTLTTDWHKSDHYIGFVKGKLLQQNLQTQIIDISHQISLYDISEAAFVLSSCYDCYPKGTVHFIGVNTDLTPKRGMLIIEHNEHKFICSDCGIPNLLFPEIEIKVWKVNNELIKASSPMDAFIHITGELANGKACDTLGSITNDYSKQIPFLPVIDENEIGSRVIYIDSYANIITNLKKDVFEQVRKGRAFKIFLQSNFYVIDTISNSYLDKAAGDLVAIFNNTGNLEIAVVYGAASELLNISKGGSIRIQFFKENNDVLKLSGN